jgi:hypothetical protein
MNGLHRYYFKPKYNVPDLWINPLNDGTFVMYSKQNNKYNKVSIRPNTLSETIITSRHNYFNFINVHDYLIRYNDSIIQLFYMWILDLQNHIKHLEQLMNKNNTL